jgi:hypothetical protein
MRTASQFLPVVVTCLTISAAPGCLVKNPGPAPGRHAELPREADSASGASVLPGGTTAAGPAGAAPAEGKESRAAAAPAPAPRPLEPFLEKALLWLVKAQHQDGGWGAGSHANQSLRDPQAVVTDPATSAFTAMALLRAGHTPVSGEHREAVARAVERLVAVVEAAPAEGPRITDMNGTQPQAKLGPYIDTSMTAQFLSRVLPAIPAESPLRPRVDAALEKCLRKLERSQEKDGSWGKAGGWAPVLQSSLNSSALELAQAAGKEVSKDSLARARSYQKQNFDVKSGRAQTDASAGVELYSFAGSQRAAASEARAAKEIVAQAKVEGRLDPAAPVNAETLRKAGVESGKAQILAEANTLNEAQAVRLGDEAMLSGFGSNGGEEYLSYLLTSESLVIAGGGEWQKWTDRMQGRLLSIQSPDGSWTGHHCITSPVFCTAAVLQCLTADREASLLAKISAGAAAEAQGK